MSLVLMLATFRDTPSEQRTVCVPAQPTAASAVRPATDGLPAGAPSRPTAHCALLSGFGAPAGYLLPYVISSARLAAIDRRLLLAVLIRESGDVHSFDWLSKTPLAWMHHFSIGITNMEYSAFEEARAYSRGMIDNQWNAIGKDPAMAITAAAFLLAKRTSQLEPQRSTALTDAEYIRIGYRAGYRAMLAAQRTGRYAPGLEFFDIAYRTASHLINPAHDYPASACNAGPA